jgi:diphosphomevalonate decarboxylase
MISRASIKVVEAINAAAGKLIAAYTFDAGPNVVTYYLEEDQKTVAGVSRLCWQTRTAGRLKEGMILRST